VKPHKTVVVPVAAVLIQRSAVAKLMLFGAGLQRALPVGPGPPKDPKPVAPKGKRAEWRLPSGTALAEVFGVGGGLEFDRPAPVAFPGFKVQGQEKPPPIPGVLRMPVRTEFVILLIWQEPLAVDGP
jgi:hypothetical protein